MNDIDEELLDRASLAAFEVSCHMHGDVANVGRSTADAPRGYRTEVMVWKAIARAVIKVYEEYGA